MTVAAHQAGIKCSLIDRVDDIHTGLSQPTLSADELARIETILAG